MNAHAEYRRHVEPPEQRASAPEHDVTNHLATHRDPSLVGPGTSAPDAATTLTGRRIAWIRPTDAYNFAGPAIARGIDLHAELVRRLRRAPAAAGRSVRRDLHVPSTPPARSTAPTQEGPSL